MTTSHDSPATITPEDLDGLTGAVLLDVRDLGEWRAGYLDGSLLLPLGLLDPAALPADAPVVVVCDTGERSSAAATLIAGTGRTAFVLEGGLRAWADTGLVLRTSDGEVGVLAPGPR